MTHHLPNSSVLISEKDVVKPNNFSTVPLRLVRSPILWVMLFAAGWQVFFYSNCESPLHDLYDTPTYLIASENPRLLLGDVDLIRTPGYPCFIAAIRHFSGKAHIQYVTETEIVLDHPTKRLLHWVVFVQQIISWISVYFFFQTAKSLFKSTFVAAAASLYYACHPAILGYNVWLMTESLAVSGTVLTVWLFISYLHRPGYGKAVMMGIILFLLIMLRPFFIFFLPVFLLFWTARLIIVREHRQQEMTGLCCALAALMLVLGYTLHG